MVLVLFSGIILLVMCFFVRHYCDERTRQFRTSDIRDTSSGNTLILLAKAAGDHEVFPSDPGGICRSQKNRGRGNVLRLSNATQWCLEIGRASCRERV